MATRLKTVQYNFPTLASLSNNSTTNLSQITIYLPETGTKSFRKVIAKVTADDIATSAGAPIATRSVGLRLGAAAYTTVSNANTLMHSGENLSVFYSADFTSHFTSNWSGTSMTCDVQVLMNQSSGTTLGMVNVSVSLEITYQYDDASTTQVKTAWIPLNAPTGALGTTKPGTPTDTIPALDTYLPEASKTYRNISIVFQGNESRTSNVDHTLSMQIDGLTALTTGNYEAGNNSDRWVRYIWNISSLGMTTNATHGFYMWASLARFNHPQVWMVVTYEFNASTTTTVMQSLMLPMESLGAMGGTSASDFQRTVQELWIEEPATITLQRLAAFFFWEQSAGITGVNARIGTGSFVSYTDVASVLSGSNGCMVRNDSGATLARGRNTFTADIYRTDSATLGDGLSGFWLVNYTSGKHASGVGAHNRTVLWNLATTGTAAASEVLSVSATNPVVPETNFFLTSLGVRYEYINNYVDDLSAPAGVSIQVERLSAESGVKWETAYADIGETDPEVGLHTHYSQIKGVFNRWNSDPDTKRLNLQTARRWRVIQANNCAAFSHLDVIMTYHTITFTVADSLSGGFSGTVYIDLCRTLTDEMVKATTRTGDGAFSFVWHDNTEQLHISASDGTHVGRSKDGLAT